MRERKSERLLETERHKEIDRERKKKERERKRLAIEVLDFFQ